MRLSAGLHVRKVHLQIFFRRSGISGLYSRVTERIVAQDTSATAGSSVISQQSSTLQELGSRRPAIDMPVIKENIELTEMECKLFDDLVAATKQASKRFVIYIYIAR